MAQPRADHSPVSDYLFLFTEWLGFDIVDRATNGEMSGSDAAEVIAAAIDFADSVLAPLQQIGDREGARLVDGSVRLPEGFSHAYQAFIDAGWVTAVAPASAGGDGLPGAVCAGLSEVWNASNAAFALCWLLTSGQIHALDAFGSKQLRERYLARLVSGDWTGTMDLTEPGAGTDLGSIRTTATPMADGTWSITGEKIFITWGDHDIAENIVHLVLARTPDAPDGTKGLSLFVAPRILVNDDGSLGARNRITTVAIEKKLGIHGSPTCALSYEGATGYLVGDLNQGLAGMFVMMNSARAGMGFQATGISDRALHDAAQYASQRIQGRVIERADNAPIADHPDVRRLLLSMASKVFAMRALGVLVGDLLDGDGDVLGELFVPIFKGWATEDAISVTSDAIQVFGGMGYIEETGVAQHFRDARIMSIYEGTTAIQSNDLVGRKVLRDGGANVNALLQRVAGTVAEIRSFGDPVAQRTADRLERAMGAARSATNNMLSFATRPRDTYAVSVPYLMMLGTLAGGWMHGLAVVAVLKHENLTAEDEGRLTLADFYGAHHLPRVFALAETVASGEVG